MSHDVAMEQTIVLQQLFLLNRGIPHIIRLQSSAIQNVNFDKS